MAAFAKGFSMGALGLWVLAMTGWRPWHHTLPVAFTRAVGLAALIAEAASFGLLWRHRSGDANMHSAWISTRTDVFGNCAVLRAAAGVFGTSPGWPDLIVATITATLGLQGAWWWSDARPANWYNNHDWPWLMNPNSRPTLKAALRIASPRVDALGSARRTTHVLRRPKHEVECHFRAHRRAAVRSIPRLRNRRPRADHEHEARVIWNGFLRAEFEF
jgi:hypothetical protein